MGVNSSILTQKVITDISTEVLNSVVSNFVTSNSANVSASQVLIIEADPNSLRNCRDASISQNMKTSLGVLTNNTSAAAADISNKATNEILTQLTQKLEQANTGLPLLQANSSYSKQEIETKIKNTIANVLTTNITNSLTVDSNNRQFLLYRIRGTTNADICTISQDMIQSVLVDATVKGAMDALLKSDIANVVTSTVTSDVKQSNTFTLLGFIGGGIFGFIILVAIIYMIYKKNNK